MPMTAPAGVTIMQQMPLPTPAPGGQGDNSKGNQGDGMPGIVAPLQAF
jgi:hypothetical protein